MEKDVLSFECSFLNHPKRLQLKDKKKKKSHEYDINCPFIFISQIKDSLHIPRLPYLFYPIQLFGFHFPSSFALKRMQTKGDTRERKCLYACKQIESARMLTFE